MPQVGGQTMDRVLVTGAGGFIGSHLVTYLKEKGYWVRGVVIKYPEYAVSDTDDFQILDLRKWDNALQDMIGIEEGLASTYTWIEQQVKGYK